MRNMILSGLVIAAGIVAGCQPQPQQKAIPSAAVRPTALDVTAPTASSTPTYHAAAVTPPSEPTLTQTPVVSQSGAASAGGNYTVKKGDTLFHIAKDKYGDGKQWTRIASANPGVTPSTLRVGQTLAIPQ